MKCFSVIKRKKMLIQTKLWMHLKISGLCEKTQAKKKGNTSYVFFHLYTSLENETIYNDGK